MSYSSGRLKTSISMLLSTRFTFIWQIDNKYHFISFWLLNFYFKKSYRNILVSIRCPQDWFHTVLQEDILFQTRKEARLSCCIFDSQYILKQKLLVNLNLWQFIHATEMLYKFDCGVIRRCKGSFSRYGKNVCLVHITSV